MRTNHGRKPSLTCGKVLSFDYPDSPSGCSPTFKDNNLYSTRIVHQDVTPHSPGSDMASPSRPQKLELLATPRESLPLWDKIDRRSSLHQFDPPQAPRLWSGSTLMSNFATGCSIIVGGHMNFAARGLSSNGTWLAYNCSLRMTSTFSTTTMALHN